MVIQETDGLITAMVILLTNSTTWFQSQFS